MSGRQKILVAVLVCLAALATIMLLARGHEPPPPARSVTVGPDLPAAPERSEPPHAVRGTWRDTVLRYAAALTPEPDADLQAWLEDLRSWVSTALLRSYRDTELDRLPRGEPSSVQRLADGKDEDRRDEGPVRARVEFGEDLVVDVTVAVVNGRWQVTTAGEHLGQHLGRHLGQHAGERRAGP